MRTLLDEEPWLSCTLDVSHALSKSPDEPMRYIELCHDRLVNVHMSRAEGKTLHLPLARNPTMVVIMQALRDNGYTGSLTLEIEDLNFGRNLTPDEKIAVLAGDCAFMHECMD
jgi:sugar phosphate isomerase/epimerase